MSKQYDTFQGAVLDNIGHWPIHKDLDTGKFVLPYRRGESKNTEHCDPKDYLISFAEFESKGGILDFGDFIMLESGSVKKIESIHQIMKHSIYFAWDERCVFILKSSEIDKKEGARIKCNECLSCKQGFSECKKYDKDGNKHSTYIITVGDRFYSDTTNKEHALEMYSGLCETESKKEIIKIERLADKDNH